MAKRTRYEGATARPRLEKLTGPCQNDGMDSAGVSRLSERQRACLRLVAQLKKTEQIAAELGISPSTVNTHIERAVATLGVPGRREAALLVLDYEATRPDKQPTEFTRLARPKPEPAPVIPPEAMMGRRRNDLTWDQRLIVALLALIGLCVAIAGLGAAIEQLSDWRASLAP